jgi:hypothetical protein
MAGEHKHPAEDREYRSYLLRLWRATCDGRTVWRASLENPHTGERAHFASLEVLFDHLRASTSRSREGGDR